MTQAVLTSGGASAAGAGSVPIVSQEWIPGAHTLRDTWFPIAHSPHVKAVPIRRLIHSQPYYLWREGSRLLAAECHPGRRAAGAAYTGFTGGSFLAHDLVNALAGHHQTKLGDRYFITVDDAHHFTAVQNHDAIGHGFDFIQILRY